MANGLSTNDSNIQLCNDSVYNIDITKGKLYSNESIEFREVLYSPELYFKQLDIDGKTYIRGCICLIELCVINCFSHVFPIDWQFNESNFICEYHIENEDKNQTEDACFKRLRKNVLNFAENEIIKNYLDPFCDLRNESYRLVLIYEIVDVICSIIAIGFSAVILSVYAMIPELRNINCKLIMCYVLAILVTLINQVILSYVLDDTIAKNFGFTIYFQHMNVLFWSNVISFDIWRTFG